jgi:hypothetical protein
VPTYLCHSLHLRFHSYDPFLSQTVWSSWTTVVSTMTTRSVRSLKQLVGSFLLMNRCWHSLRKYSGSRLEYLPPYSPDYNPIEVTFSMIKYWLKHNEGLVYDDQALLDLVEDACEAITGEDALGWFHNSAYE